MSWMGPAQFHTWSGRSAPTGWPNSWPPTAPMGYPGPPPAPPGIDSRTWFGGQWQINPMFRGNAAAAVQPQAWAPHPSWGVPPVAAPSFNPYKRIPNPGDANYWQTKLSENPLGLENMIPCVVSLFRVVVRQLTSAVFTIIKTRRAREDGGREAQARPRTCRS